MWNVLDTQTGVVTRGFKTKAEAVSQKMSYLFSGPEFSDEDNLLENVQKAIEVLDSGKATPEFVDEWADETSDLAQSYKFFEESDTFDCPLCQSREEPVMHIQVNSTHVYSCPHCPFLSMEWIDDGSTANLQDYLKNSYKYPNSADKAYEKYEQEHNKAV